MKARNERSSQMWARMRFFQRRKIERWESLLQHLDFLDVTLHALKTKESTQTFTKRT